MFFSLIFQFEIQILNWLYWLHGKMHVYQCARASSPAIKMYFSLVDQFEIQILNWLYWVHGKNAQ